MPVERVMAARVVVVDDDHEVRERLRDALVERGFEVSLAESGLRLISILRQLRPAAILLDVKLPWTDGFALCRALKSNPEYHELPICIISGLSDPADLRAALECGAADYFVKPLDLEALVRRVAELTGQAPGASGATGPETGRSAG